MTFDQPGDIAAIAGEYVLGTLDAADRAAVEARLEHDAALQAEVYRWQDTLMPLLAAVEPAEPAPSLWRAIESRLLRTAPPPARTPAANDPLWRRLRRWQFAGALGIAASVVLSTLLVLRSQEAPAVRYLTLLQEPTTQRTGWVVEATTGQRVRLMRIGAPEPVAAGKTMQFWTKAEGATSPTSLGLVGSSATVEVPASLAPSIGERQLFELTLEPEKGSPTGLPTGPILYVGRSVRL